MNCPTCQSHVNKNNPQGNYSSPVSSHTYSLYRCAQCDLEFWEPRKLAQDLYEQDSFSLYGSAHVGLRRIRPYHRTFFENLPISRGRLLDIGCADGAFLKEAVLHGFEVWGLDFDQKSVERAIANGLPKVYNISLEKFCDEAHKKALQFHVVSCFEVLEHQDEPMRFIQQIKGLLADGGYIVGSVPNRERLFCKKDRTLSLGDYPPHHFLYFSKGVIRTLLRQEKFKNIEVMPVKQTLNYLSAYIESMLLGSVSAKVKSFIKKKILNESVSSFAFDEAKGAVEKKPTLILGYLLKWARNFVFFPLAMIVKPVFNKIGYKIYFQALQR